MTTKGKRENRRLSQPEFEEAAGRVRMSDDMRYAAFAYMVLGNTFEAIARATGINDRQIQRKVRDIWNTHHARDEHELPENWGREMIALPIDQLELVKQRSRELLQRERERKAEIARSKK